MFDHIFNTYHFVVEKAISFGFVDEEGVFLYQKDILDQEFSLQVMVKDGSLSFKVFDWETGDEYVQVQMEKMQGQFVGQVREACLEELTVIRNECFERQDFIYPQTKRVMQYIEERYQGHLEYLWDRSPDAAALRHSDTLKWYGLLIAVDWSKLVEGRTGKIEILNLKHDQVSQLLQQGGIYPAYHMNKKYWISIPLDETLSDEMVTSLLDRSWDLTKK